MRSSRPPSTKKVSCRAVGHGETDGMENGVDALEHPRHRMQPGDVTAAARKRHIERLRLELRRESRLGEGVAARLQGGFDARLGVVDASAGALPLLGL